MREIIVFRPESGGMRYDESLKKELNEGSNALLILKIPGTLNSYNSIKKLSDLPLMILLDFRKSLIQMPFLRKGRMISLTGKKTFIMIILLNLYQKERILILWDVGKSKICLDLKEKIKTPQ